jgi:uncharacterized protein (DUF608 family)
VKRGFLYTDENTDQISFPLGGIGTGCIGLGGDGRLIDWEIFNRPAKGSTNGMSHFAVKAEEHGKVLDARILNADLRPPFTGVFSKPHYSYFGFGPPREYLAGVPHFHSVEFRGEYPLAELKFSEERFPGEVRLVAFNPLIPLNSDDSSIPAAFFEVSVKNTTERPLTYTVSGCLRNPFPDGTTVNRHLSTDGFNIIKCTSVAFQEDEFGYGDLCLATDAEEASYQEYLYRGLWFDNIYTYWRELTTPGPFKNRSYEGPRKETGKQFTKDYGALASHMEIPPGQTWTARFIVSWSFPNCSNYWNPEKGCEEGDCSKEGGCTPNRWKNYYTTLFKDSTASAVYSLKNWDRLHERTRAFKEALFSSTLPEEVLDAVSANISILKSPTVLRLEDGTLYGWEGCFPDSGCCDGSCSHVWNYEYATPFLFPDLERSMRDVDFRFNSAEDGSISFRLQLPLGRPRLDFRPCADGQMGGVIQTYREWKISGDTEWLRSNWQAVKSSLEFAWSEDNRDKWDRDKDGVMEGRQHHTLDLELFGPNAWLTGYYLAALKAASLMAEHLGEEDKAREYRDLFERGKAWVDQNLFNGEYYQQEIDLKDRRNLECYGEEGSWAAYRNGRSRLENYWDEESGEVKYQIADGCGVDQVIAQWHANLCGLGEIFDKDKCRKALESIYRYNYKHSMREFFNPCRVFCLNDEAGVVICDYPRGRPAVPVGYAEETMNGFEYQAACHMIQEGMIEQGLEIVRAIRDRFEGSKRNPWNEFECGSNYARSMASYSLLLTLSGFTFDMVEKAIGFRPLIHEETFRCFWSIGSGWGTILREKGRVSLSVLHGKLSLKRFAYETPKGLRIQSARRNSEDLSIQVVDGSVVFDREVELSEGDVLGLDLKI